MSIPTLVIGNKNISSWSLRPWLALKRANIYFEEIIIHLRKGDSKDNILRYSPNGQVPCLLHGDLVVWDSIAILEYVAELSQSLPLWPQETRARAVARSVAAEMHAGFAALRKELPMDVRSSLPHPLPLLPEVEANIARIQSIWNNCRTRFGKDGPFLFGQFSNADAMYAPVVTRFATYGIKLEEEASEYVATITSMPEIKEWIKDAKLEA